MKAAMIILLIFVLIGEILFEVGLYVYCCGYRGCDSGRYMYEVYLYAIGIIPPHIREFKNIYVSFVRTERGEGPIPFGLLDEVIRYGQK
jgi:hypothetical protein